MATEAEVPEAVAGEEPAADIAEEAEEVEAGEEEEEEEEQDEEALNTVENSDVATKYRDAARVVNTALEGCVSQCVAGASVLDVCKFGDAVINQSTERLYRRKVGGQPIQKGVAFPTCVSVNEIVCHHSPLEADRGTLRPLQDGDLVKLDLGCHIDGYIALAAHTVIVGADLAETPLSGPRADAFAAAYTALDVCERLIKNGNTNEQVTAAVGRVAESFGVNLIQGTMMHQMKRFVIDASKMICLVEEPEARIDECTFETGEVYCIDVAVSTGDGKCREAEIPTTVYKRIVENTYNLRQRFARQLLRDINNKSPTLPFTLRAMGAKESEARAGIRECLGNDLLLPYPVMVEREDETVVHVKCTVLLLPGGTTRITGLTFPPNSFNTDKTPDEETAAILAQAGKKKRRKKKKKASANGEAEE